MTEDGAASRTAAKEGDEATGGAMPGGMVWWVSDAVYHALTRGWGVCVGGIAGCERASEAEGWGCNATKCVKTVAGHPTQSGRGVVRCELGGNEGEQVEGPMDRAGDKKVANVTGHELTAMVAKKMG